MTAKVDRRELGVREHDLPLDLKLAITWAQLAPAITMTEPGLPGKTGYTRADLLELLGCSMRKLREQMAAEVIPRPTARGRMESRRGPWSRFGLCFVFALRKEPKFG